MARKRNLSPEWYLRALAAVEVGRVRAGLAVGLRDRAVLALLANGVRPGEIALLSCREIEVQESSGRLTISRPADEAGWHRVKVLDVSGSAQLLAWLAEVRTWGEDVPVFGGLSVVAIYGVVERIRREIGP